MNVDRPIPRPLPLAGGESAWPPHARRAARAAGLVQERRQRRMAVRAEGRGRPRPLPARARAGRAGDGARARLQPHRPRRRRAGRRGPPRQAVREDRADGRNDAALRRRRERDPRILDRAGPRHCRAGVPARDPRHRRRVRADERRRLWPRGQRHPRLGAAGAALGRSGRMAARASSATPTATARCPKARS